MCNRQLLTNFFIHYKRNLSFFQLHLSPTPPKSHCLPIQSSTSGYLLTLISILPVVVRFLCFYCIFLSPTLGLILRW